MTMTGLYIDISDYYTDPIEEEVERVIDLHEEYDIIPSSSNFAAVINPQRTYKTPPQGERGRFIRQSNH